MRLKNISIFLVSLCVISCQSFELRNYKLAYKYHDKVGGGVTFGVLDHEFEELTDAQIDHLLRYSVIVPPHTWGMISHDLIKACRMLGKKCKNEVSILNSMLNDLNEMNSHLESILKHDEDPK